MATVGVLAAASAAPGWVAQDAGRVARGRVDRAQPETEKPPSIAGHWIVLYIAGTAGGKRQGYVEPGLMVPVTEDTINLPSLTGNDRDPIRFPRKMEYSTDREGGLSVIEAVGEHGPDGAEILLRGIYRVAGENLVICYDSDQGVRPTSFAAAKPTETLLILRPEPPAPKHLTPFPRVDGYLAPPRPTQRYLTPPRPTQR
jgi:hypothetical protein